MAKHFDRLLTLSGGIDSTYVLYKHVTEIGTPLVVHHCNIKNNEKRDKVETRAAREVVRYMREKHGADITYTESTFDYGNNAIVQDIELIGFVAGMVFRNPAYQIDGMYICASKYDMEQPGNYELRSRRRFQIIKAMTDREDIVFDYIIKDTPREDIIRELPKELLFRAWFCRRPNGEQICGKCKTCNVTVPTLKELGFQWRFKSP
jgi:hypothetical protein